MKPVITQRIIKKNKRVGMIMAFKFTDRPQEDSVRIGFCLCSPQDKYSHELAEKICYARAATNKEAYNVPDSIIKDFEKFRSRCIRYFKDIDFVEE